MRSWLIVILIIICLVIAAAFASLSLFWISKPISVSRDSVLELKLGGRLLETPSDNPLVQLLSEDRPTLLDYWKLLHQAAGDQRIKGAYLEIQPLALSWAQIEELRDGLQVLRDAGKPVHAFVAVDLLGEPEMYLASVANTITVNPETPIVVNGLLAEVTFYKRTLEKLGVKPQFIQFKEYKSPEVYSREDLSPPIREMYVSILEDLENRFVETVALDRSIEPTTVRDIISRGILAPPLAQEQGLIDEVGYREQVRNRFVEDSTEDYHGIDARDYLEATVKRQRSLSGNRVALVTATGIITSGRTDSFSETLGGSTLAGQLMAIRNKEDFDAVLLRVDSPGGSAVGSDMVWKEVGLLRESGIPVVVSMSGVAGSGGYYISMGADRIICQPSTITGSIGVIFGKFNFEGLYDWLGMEVDRVKLSPNADLFSPFTTLTEAQEEMLRLWIQEVYEGFVSKAAEGRDSSFEELESMARGRIYTGSQAVNLGLADATGGFTTAVHSLKDILGLSPDQEIQLVQYPPPKTLWESLSSVGLIETAARRESLQGWLETELKDLTEMAPRLIMPEARIY